MVPRKLAGIKTISRENISADDSSITMKNAKDANVSHISENQTKPCIIIFWSTYFGQPKLDETRKWEKGECPMAGEVTIAQSRVREAGGFVVHARDPHDSTKQISALDPAHTRKPSLYAHTNQT